MDERRKLSEDERRLWGNITRSVAPLRRKPAPLDRPQPAAPAAKSKPLPAARARPAAGIAVPAPAPQLESLDRRTRQRLARGTVEIDGRLDLHGMIQSEAHLALLRFLRRAQADGGRFVLVITGKGTRAGTDWSERGVLKRQVPLWLKLPEFRPYVSGFEDAHIGHGGDGALYVRVRRAR